MIALKPPYYQFDPMPLGEVGAVPIGAVVFASEGSPIESLAALVRAVRRLPWVIPSVAVLRQDRACVDQLIECMPDLLGRVALFELGPVPRPATAWEIVLAVGRRRRPSARDLVEYVARRISDRLLVEAVSQQFHQALEPDRSRANLSLSTYSRLFRRYGPWTARDWRAVARLAVRWSEERPRATRRCRVALRHSLRYLGMSRAEAAVFLGWEWVLERALAMARLVPSHAPSSVPDERDVERYHPRVEYALVHHISSGSRRSSVSR